MLSAEVVADLNPPDDPAEVDAWLTEREEEFAAAFSSAFGEVVADAVRAYADTLTAAGDESVFDVGAALVKNLARTGAEWLSGMHLAGSLSAWVAAGEPLQDAANWLSVVHESAVEYQRTATNRVVGLATQVWHDVRDRTVLSLQHGIDNEGLTRAVERATGYSEFRANTIARTETVAAYNGGDWDGMRALGDAGPVEKVWIATRDSRTRRDHANADDQVRPFDEPFDVGGEQMMRPHDRGAPPEQVVNCRCVVEYLFVGDTRPDGSTIEGVEPSEPVLSAEPVRS